MRNWIAVASVVLSLAAVVPARAAAPHYVPLQGVLTDPAGVPINTTLGVVFGLYAAETGGSPLWTEPQSVTVQNGLFVAYLGTVTPLDLSLFRDNGLLWLGVKVGSDDEMARVLLGSAPFTGFAEYCGNVPTHTHPLTDVTGTAGVVVGEQACTGTDKVTGVNAAGAITCAADTGFTTDAQLTALLDDNYLNVNAVETTTASQITSACFDSTFTTLASAGAVLRAENNSADSTGFCLNMQRRIKVALLGVSSGNGWDRIGVAGVATAGSSGGGNYGVVGVASGPQTNQYGVWGTASGGTNNYAGYFVGNVHVAGTLSKSAGTFLIDHPTDPRNKVLRHSFVESPVMMNVYDGVAVLDSKGETVVRLPEYFGALNRDFRYQLTPIGGYARVYVKREISDNHFVIASADQRRDAGLRVSWQVTGTRKDAYAQANPVVVEEPKTGTNGFVPGECLYPEACR